MKRLVRQALLTCSAILAASCAMGPDYERPEVVAPESYQTTTIPGLSFANMDWWELFDDEILLDLIQAALVNNKELAIAMLRIEEARASLGFVRSDQYPNLDGTAGAGRGNSIPGVGVPGAINESFVLAADLSFEIDLWGKLRRSTEAARAELLATVEARNVVTITLIADVASLYLLLLDLDDRVVIAKRTQETREDSLRIIQARFDKGTVPLIDVNQGCHCRVGGTGATAAAGGEFTQRLAGQASGSDHSQCGRTVFFITDTRSPGRSAFRTARTAAGCAPGVAAIGCTNSPYWCR
jgi:multidrug efflux system outer membrane protein